MKITCQSCQSKYTIADEKIHGKVAKIRCRKCGETIEVDGTRLGAEATEVAQQPESPASSDAVWTVNIADDDQRTMTLPELVDAYHSGVITAETYLWAEGMTDWVPLAEVPEVVAALGSETPPDEAEPVRDSMFHEPPAAMGDDAPADSARGGDEDLGQGGFSPTSTPQPLGARDEQSVLFSLSALTASAPKVSVPPSSTGGPTEDSGLIDLNALAAKAQESSAGEAEAPTPAPAPLLFPAALGSVEPVTTTAQAPAPAPSSSKAPMFIGAGIAIAGVAVAAVMALRPAEPPPAPAPMPTAAAVTPSAAPTPEPAPVASAEPEPEPAPVASAEPEPAPAPTTTAKKAATTTKKAPAKAATKQPAKAPAKTGTTKPASAPAKKSNCGCAPTDLQCQIRCSAMGK